MAGLSGPQAAAVKTTFDIANKDQKGTVVGFYNKLFASNPEMKNHFKNFTGDLGSNPHMAAFAPKFMTELGEIVGALNDSGALNAALEANAKRHIGPPRNLKHGQYETVLKALVAYMQEALGSSMTGDAVSGWNGVVSAIVNKIKSLE